MSLWRKKPVVIEAFRWTGDIDQTEDPEWAVNAIKTGKIDFHKPGTPECRMVITTLEGAMEAMPGDYIIKGVKGELYPCKPDIFNLTYEPAWSCPEADPIPRKVKPMAEAKVEIKITDLPEVQALMGQVEAMEKALERMDRTNDALVDTIATLRWRAGNRGDLREVCVAMADPKDPTRCLIVKGLPEGLEAFKNLGPFAQSLMPAPVNNGYKPCRVCGHKAVIIDPVISGDHEQHPLRKTNE